MTQGHGTGEAKSSASIRAGKHILVGRGGGGQFNVSRIRGEEKNAGNCGKAAYL